MQPDQPDHQRNDRYAAVGDSIEVFADPGAIVDLIGSAGEQLQTGASVVLDGFTLAVELASELLSGLGS